MNTLKLPVFKRTNTQHHKLKIVSSSFRKHHGTNTASTKVLKDIRHTMDYQYLTFLVLLDHSEAFDINFHILAAKLHYMGCNPVECLCLRNYIR